MMTKLLSDRCSVRNSVVLLTTALAGCLSTSSVADAASSYLSSSTRIMTSPIYPGRFLEGDVDNETYATCGGCWCIPDAGTDNACPSDPPLTLPDFPQVPWIDNLNALQLDNPLSLDCDPYSDEACDTVPPLVEGNACVWEMVPIGDGGGEAAGDTSASCAENYTYRLTTVPETFEEATAKGMLVTHQGACGLCSTFQDWAIYMTVPDLNTVGTQCGAQFLFNQTRGIECFMKAGFTEGCSNIWAWNGRQTSRACPSCVAHSVSGLPSNLPPPTCYLAECIQCDEDESGPLFLQFSGRTRRNSGLLSGIARNCSTISKVQPMDPCAVLNAEPSLAPTLAPSSSRAKHENFRHLLWMSGIALAGLLVGPLR